MRVAENARPQIAGRSHPQIVGWLLLAWLSAAPLLASEPLVRTIAPAGAQRGTEVELRVTGTQLRGVEEVLFYSPGIEVVSINEPASRNAKGRGEERVKGKQGNSGDNGNSARIRLEIAPDCPLGLHDFRLRTDSGISNLVSFSVGDLRSVDEKEPNDDLAAAQEIPLDATVSGVIAREDCDWFRIQAEADHRLTVEVEAVRLGGDFVDPVLSVYGDSGELVAEADDTVAAHQDSVCSFVAPTSGSYLIRLQEVTFGGSPQARYRLHVGRFPRPLAVFPPGGQPGQSISLTLLGDLRGPLVKAVTLPSELGATYGITAVDDGGVAPWPLPFRLSALENAVEQEPNDAFGSATAFSAPGAVNGILSQPGDVDHFKFSAKKGAVLDVRVFARSLRSPVDTVIAILRANGRNVGNNDDSGGPDSYLRFTAPADEEYTLVVRDQLGRGGPHWVYRVEFTAVEPGLGLSLPERKQYQDVVAPVPQGNRLAVLVQAVRGEFDGAVDLAFSGLPEGLRADMAPIDGGLPSNVILLSASDDAPLGGALADLTGAHRKGDQTITGRLAQRTLLVRGQNNRDVWGRDHERMAVAVTRSVPLRLDLEPGGAPLLQGGTLDLAVRAIRASDFRGPVALTLLHSAPGVSASGGVSIAEGKDQAVLPLTANANARIGSYRIALLGEANFGDGPTLVSTGLMELKVEPSPVSLESSPQTADQGEKTTWTWKVVRKEGFAAEFQAELVGLPYGVTSQPQKIGAEGQEIVFPLELAVKASPGRHKNVMCRITLPMGGESVKCLLGPGELRVRPAPGGAKEKPG
ncbi:MAG: PPC domain-containing protein [Planctomycetota bacterium]